VALFETFSGAVSFAAAMYMLAGLIGPFLASGLTPSLRAFSMLFGVIAAGVVVFLLLARHWHKLLRKRGAGDLQLLTMSLEARKWMVTLLGMTGLLYGSVLIIAPFDASLSSMIVLITNSGVLAFFALFLTADLLRAATETRTRYLVALSELNARPGGATAVR